MNFDHDVTHALHAGQFYEVMLLIQIQGTKQNLANMAIDMGSEESENPI